jgi:hypothetical protein
MGHEKKNGLGRLRGIAAGLAAAAALGPGVTLAADVPLPEAIETEAVAARFTRAENALAKAIARSDAATLRVFACDCAARVAPLYERAGCSAKLLRQARARAIESPVVPPEPLIIDGAATLALGEIVFERGYQHVLRLENQVPADPTQIVNGEDQPARMLAVAMVVARAIDDAVLIASGGSLSRIDNMCNAIGEAVYLDHLFRRGERAPAIKAVFRELAWQRAHLRALQSNA